MTYNQIALRITARKMNRIFWMLFLSPVMIYLLVNIYYSGYREFWHNFIGIGVLPYISVFFIICIIHELLHVLAGVVAGAKLKSFYFGIDRANLSIICGCRDEISVQGYQFFLLLPFIVLTPLVAGLAYFNETHIWWYMLTISTSGCAFDLTVSMGLIGIPGKTRVIPDIKGENGLVFLEVKSRCSRAME